MKVLFLSHYFAPEGNAPATRTFEHAKRWIEAGLDVTVITSNPNVPHGRLYAGYRNRLCQTEYLDGIRVVRVWTYLAANAGNLRRSLNYLSFLFSAVIAGLTVSKPKVIVATSPQFFCGWAGVILSRLLNVKLVIEIRDIWPDSIAAVGAIKNPLPLRVLTMLEKTMYEAADHIVTVGDGYREVLVERHVPLPKITVIPNGADLDRFRLDVSPIQVDEDATDSSTFRCLYVGTVGMASGLDLIIRAAKILKIRGDESIRFIIVGDGADRSRLQRLCCESGLTNVIFTGLVKKSLIPAYVKAAHACLVHLRNDPLFKTVLPSKLFEALAMEKPVILGVKGSASALLIESGGGISIEPENEQELLTAIDTLKGSDRRCKALGNAGRRYVSEYFNRDHFARLYVTRVLEKYR